MTSTERRTCESKADDNSIHQLILIEQDEKSFWLKEFLLSIEATKDSMLSFVESLILASHSMNSKLKTLTM